LVAPMLDFDRPGVCNGGGQPNPKPYLIIHNITCGPPGNA